MTTWADLSAELDLWADAGKTARFWWRDDDATRDTPALDRLFETARAIQAPPAIAVIPFELHESLLARDDWPTDSAIVQHGYAHANHAPLGEKKAEFGRHRPETAMLDDIARGWRVLARIGHAIAAFVPPWNRIADSLAARLPDIGIAALSTFGPRSSARPADNLVQVNTHIDPIDWRGSRRYLGDEAVLTQVVRHLSARRLGTADPHEATGLLTHHLVHDESCWRFVSAFGDVVGRHTAAAWSPPREVFGA